MLFDLVRAAREVIASDTQHPSSNLELVHYLKDLLSCIDFELVEQTASVGDRVQANIIGLRGPTTVGDGLILSSPLDTVPYVDRDTWRTCAGEPLEPVLSAGAIFGLGARSGKIDFLCKLKAAAQFQGRPLSRPLYLAGTFGRYHDFLGVRTLLETHLFRAKRVLVGWPTNLELVTTVKSHVVFRFCFTCEAGERSPGGTPLELITRAPCAPSEWPGLGDDVVRRALRAFTTARKGNPGLCLTGVAATAPAGLTPHSCRLAVVGAASAELGSEWSPCAAGEELVDLSAVVPAVTLVIEALDQLLADLEPLSDHSFRPPHATATVQSVSSSENELTLIVLCRFLPDQDVSTLIERLEREVARVSSEAEGLSITTRVELAIPPMSHAATSTFASDALAAMRKVGLVAVESALNQGSEAALYESHGYEALIFGPGWPTWTDVSDEEYVTLEQLEKATAFYAEMIRRHCCD